MIATYHIIEAPPEEAIYTPYGGCADFFYSREPEHIAHGSVETGKTLAACWKLHILACKYPGAQFGMVRKTYNSLMSSAFQTLKGRVLEPTGAPVVYYGGEIMPTQILYPNKSVIWLGGMDNPKKVLSSERDAIFYNQVEEGTLAEWETLTTRVTGRAGNMPYAIVFGDCNPDAADHWIQERAKNQGLQLIQTTRRDNPMLYDPSTGELTEQGIQTMRRVDKLTGLRRSRLRDGLWISAEGVIYEEFIPDIHIKQRDYGDFKYWLMCADDGYTNPAVVLLVGVDADWRLHICREFYETGKRHSQIAKAAIDLCHGIRPAVVATDPSAAGLIAEFRNHGLNAEGASGLVADGIDTIKELLVPQDDDLPRLTVAPECVNTIREFQSYIWATTRTGETKDEPKKVNDHVPDSVRYLTNWLFAEQIFVRQVDNTVKIGNW